MRLEDYDYDAEKEINPPKIIWDDDDRDAIIAFLLLSVDGKMSDEDMKKFAAYKRITQEEEEERKNSWVARSLSWAKPYGRSTVQDTGTIRDTIIREGGAFLDSLDHEERYDCIIGEIDRVIKGSKKCDIGDGYGAEGDELLGSVDMLFDYVKLLYSDQGCSKNQQRLLKHLARKWDIDQSVLPILQTSIKSLDEISRKRIEVQEGDMPYREATAVLSTLDAEEKAVCEKLNALIGDDDAYKYIPYIGPWLETVKLVLDTVTKNRSFESADEVYKAYTDQGLILSKNEAVGIYNGFKKPDQPLDETYDEKEARIDEIGGGIVEGIMKVGDIICAPFEWMTEKISGW